MISVVLVTYNSMSVLPPCLKSLELSSSAHSLEVVAADNGSSDGTVKWLEAYAISSLPFVDFKVLPLVRNRGYAYANNRAIELTHGEVVLLLNPDTIVQPETIEVCNEILSQNSRIGAVGCRLVLQDGRLDRACKRSFPTFWNSFTRFTALSFAFPRSRLFASYNLTYRDEYGCYPVDSLSGAFLMVPSHVMADVGGLDEDYFMYGEDIDFCYRVKSGGYEVWYEGSVSTTHLKGGNGGKRSPESLKYFYDTMYLYYSKTHGTRRATIALSLKLLLRVMWGFHVVVSGCWKRPKSQRVQT